MKQDYQYGIDACCRAGATIRWRLSEEALSRFNERLAAEAAWLAWSCRGLTVFCEADHDADAPELVDGDDVHDHLTFASIVMRGPRQEPPSHLAFWLNRALACAFHEAGVPVSLEMDKAWELITQQPADQLPELQPTALPT